MAQPQRFLWILLLICGCALAAREKRCRLLLPFVAETEEERVDAPPYKHLSRARDYRWTGERPSEALWANTALGGGQYFLNDTAFERLTFKLLTEHAEAAGRAHFYFGQAFLPSTSDESRLLIMSLLDSNPHEVAQVVIHTGKERFVSSVIHGRSRAVSGRGVRALLDHSLAQVRGLPSEPEIVELEIVHTHPSASFLERAPGEKDRPRVHALSPADIKSAIALSEKFPTYRIRVRAVLPEGITFEKVFQNGSDVTRLYGGRGR